MHTSYLLFLACLFPWLVQAQEETLFDDVDIVGAFGSPILEFSSINGEAVADVGGGGALVIGEFFLGGYGLGNDFTDTEIEGFRYEIELNHGGLWFGYAYRQNKVIHLYTDVRIGWGSARLKGDGPAAERDRILAITPQVGAEVNILPFFKLALSGGYRLIDGVNDLRGLDNNDFASPVGTLTFRFGGFGDYEQAYSGW